MIVVIPGISVLMFLVIHKLQSMGIEATLSISYVPANEADQLGEPWTR